MHTIFLDFETFYAAEYTLAGTKTSTSDYVRDERFKAHMVGWAVDDEPTCWCDTDMVRTALARLPWSESTLVCHNTAFDGFILSHQYGLVPARYTDTMLISRAVFGANVRHGLEDVGTRLNLGAKIHGRLEPTRGIRDLPDELLLPLAEYCMQDVDLMRSIYHQLIDKVPPRELDLIDITLRMFCVPVLQVDRQRVQDELEREVGQKVAKVLMAGVMAEDLSSNERFAKLLSTYGVDAPQKISRTTGKVTWAFAKKDVHFLELRRHSDKRIADLIEARLAVKSTIGETRALRFLKATENDWLLPVLLQFCGAHTTRWSAGNKMNMQNLRRGGELRKSILAPPGYVICTLDSSQIEARMNLWLAGDEEKLEIFRKYDLTASKEFDPYRIMAGLIYEKRPEDTTDLERFVGKVCILALGYQMGAARLQHTLETDENKPMHLSLLECQRIVNLYRTTNEKIGQLWEHMEQIISIMCSGGALVYRALEFAGNQMILPSGLAIHYDGLAGAWSAWTNRFVDCTYVSARSKFPIKLYGGLVTENAVQGLARVAVGDYMWEIAQRYRIVLMAHDEVSYLAPEANAEEALDFGLRIFRTPPVWAPTLPVNAEGKVGPRYMK